MSFRPGLTGMWQVSGRSNITDFEEVVKLSSVRISRRSLKRLSVISNIRGHLNAPNNFTNLNFDDQVLFSRAARTICDRIYKDSKYDWDVVLENYRTKINSFILSNDSEEKKKATEDMNLSWEGW